MKKGLASIEIVGLRGFADAQRLDFGDPNGEPGSGLTILVGPNNSGKSTIVEALTTISKQLPPALSEGMRNALAGSCVSIRISASDGSDGELRTVDRGGARTVWSGKLRNQRIYVLPSRRTFNPFFKYEPRQRSTYVDHMPLPTVRGAPVDEFARRIAYLQESHEQRKKFDEILDELIGRVDWTIEQADSGDSYLKFTAGGVSHNSDGIGEGLLSLFFIADALYDSEERDMIVIDEPELSLHPALQKRLRRLLSKWAGSRQIVYATHSPYFVDWNDISNGSRLHRVYSETGRARIGSLTRETAEKVRGRATDLHNPHTLGLNAREVFFLGEAVILVEGQDDAVWYPRIAEELEVPLQAEVYGWGVGGAEKMEHVCAMLRELGFRRVAGLLDADKSELRDRLARAFPQFHFAAIPAADVRTKPERTQKSVVGLLDEKNHLREQHRDAATRLLRSLNEYLTGTDTDSFGGGQEQ